MLTNDKSDKSTSAAKPSSADSANTQKPTKKRYRRRNGRIAGASNAGNSPNSSLAVLTPNANRRTAGANWNAAALTKNGAGNENSSSVSTAATAGVTQKKPRPQHQFNKQPKPTQLVAMDCEMVGIGFQGRDDMVARVSIVDEVGNVLLDKYVKPVEIITDYRTPVSGIRPLDLKDGEEFALVQQEVIDILKDRILVGHNVRKDLQVLHISHPYRHIRDTSNYRPLAKLVSAGKTPSLKRLSAKILGNEIQTGEHNSIEDAKAAMDIYQSVATQWEQSLEKKHYRKH